MPASFSPCLIQPQSKNRRAITLGQKAYLLIGPKDPVLGAYLVLFFTERLRQKEKL